MIPHSPIRGSRCFHRGSFTYSVIPGISYRFISKYDIMCFSCIHPYHSRNLHTNLWLFHTGFIGWTESVDESHAYMTPSISATTMKDSMDMHIGDGFASCSFNAHTLYSHSGIGGFRKNKKGGDDSDFSGILLVSLSLRRIYHMTKHRNACPWIFMDAVMFLWSHCLPILT